MSYVQHTKCIELHKFQPQSYKAKPAIDMLVLFGGTLAWVAALIPIVMADPWCALHAIPLMLYGGIFGYANWWLYYRLVCLGGDRCAIGMVVSVAPASEKTGWDVWDTDFSVNLLLPETDLGVTQDVAETKSPLGVLIKATPEVKARADIGFSGETATPEGGTDKSKSAILHAEFEGAGVWIVFLSSAAALMVVVAAIAVCMVPVWGWVASWLLELLAFLIMLFGGVAGQDDAASPTDVSPSLGTLHHGLGDSGFGADILYVDGTWVFDGGHEDEHRGWNEIHPIKNAVIIGKWTGLWNTSVDTRFKSLVDLCEAMHGALGTAQGPLTVTAQGQPENQWVWHPLIDGCRGEELRCRILQPKDGASYKLPLGKPIELQGAVEGDSAASLRWKVTATNAGTATEVGTGSTVAWTPPAVDPDDYAITLTATGAGGKEATASVKVSTFEIR